MSEIVICIFVLELWDKIWSWSRAEHYPIFDSLILSYCFNLTPRILKTDLSHKHVQTSPNMSPLESRRKDFLIYDRYRYEIAGQTAMMLLHDGPNIMEKNSWSCLGYLLEHFQQPGALVIAVIV